jgi:hypothetical protein
VKKPVSKFAFQVHNLQRYIAALARVQEIHANCRQLLRTHHQRAVGLCTLESSWPITHNL